MALSIHKLEKLLSGRDLLAKKYFVMHGLCVYVEVLSLITADSFLLYIPGKYEIQVPRGDNVYQVKYIDITEDGNITGDYAGEPDDYDLEKQYEEVDLDFDLNARGGDMQEHLEGNYNHPLSLKDMSREDKMQLREIFRQLRRMKFCVQNLKYKLCILYKDYMCCIRRDDTFEGYMIKHLRGPAEKKLMVTIDLESLYGMIESIHVDVTTVREGVYRVLDKNQSKHVVNLQKILAQQNVLNVFSDNIAQKKERLLQYLTKLEKLLQTLVLAEKGVAEKILLTQQRGESEIGLKGMQVDIQRTHQMAKYDEELRNIHSIKQELIQYILMIKTKYENLALKTDRIVFDNIVMIDAILKNFIALSEL